MNPDEGTIVPTRVPHRHGSPQPAVLLLPVALLLSAGGRSTASSPVLAPVLGPFLARNSFTIDPGPYYLAGRLLVVALGTASVYLVYRLGREAFGARPGGATVGKASVCWRALPGASSRSTCATRTWRSPTCRRRRSRCWRCCCCVGAAQGRGRRWLVAGAIAAGLATSVKYNLGMLAHAGPLAGWRAGRRPVGGGRRSTGATMRRPASGGGARPPSSATLARACASWCAASTCRCLLAFIGDDAVRDPRLPATSCTTSRARTRSSPTAGSASSTSATVLVQLQRQPRRRLRLVLLALALAGVALALWRRSRVDLHHRALRRASTSST